MIGCKFEGGEVAPWQYSRDTKKKTLVPLWMFKKIEHDYFQEIN